MRSAALVVAVAALAGAAPSAASPPQAAEVTTEPATTPGPAPMAPEVQQVTMPEDPAPPPVPTATASAGDPPVTIAGFAFHAATTTIHVGDTVTWTNQDSAGHTATASDRSFDTGVLKKGASAGHTFRSAGTFSYICTIHPSMKGTIRVTEAAATQPAPSRSAPAPAPAASSGPAPQGAGPVRARPQLPATGDDPLLAVAVGLGLLALGLTARRAAT